MIPYRGLYSQECNSEYINRCAGKESYQDRFLCFWSVFYLLSSGQFLAMPGWSSSCSETITSFLVGVEVRDLLCSPAVIDLWRPSYNLSGALTGYWQVPDAQTYLNFRQGDFTPDGVYQYHISDSGIRYQSGDYFSVYQSSNPDSPVRIFYTNQLAALQTVEKTAQLYSPA